MAGPRTGIGTMVPAPSGRQGSAVAVHPIGEPADPIGVTAGLVGVTAGLIDATELQTVAERLAAVTSARVTDEAAETIARRGPISAPGLSGHRSRRSLRVSSPLISIVPHGRGCARCPRTTRRAWRAIS